MNKESKNKLTVPGEKLMIDISSIKTKNKKKVSKFWLLVVDEATSMKWSFFSKRRANKSIYYLVLSRNYERTTSKLNLSAVTTREKTRVSRKKSTMRG